MKKILMFCMSMAVILSSACTGQLSIAVDPTIVYSEEPDNKQEQPEISGPRLYISFTTGNKR